MLDLASPPHRPCSGPAWWSPLPPSRAAAAAVDRQADRPFACPVPGCNKTFRRRFTLKEHVTTHTGEKAFVCSVRACRRGFSTSGNLARHKRAQHPWLDALLGCLVDDCGCAFSTEAKLERHMKMVHFSASSYPCQVSDCGRAFSNAGNLRRHMSQFHGRRDYTPQEIQRVAPPAAKSSPRVNQVSVAKQMPIVSVEPSTRHWSPRSVDDELFDAELLDVLAGLFD